MSNPLLKELRPVHPGEILREELLPAVGKTKAEIARLLRVSRQALYDILDEEKPVTPQMAFRLAKMFGSSPEFWLGLQQRYDLTVLAPVMADELEHIPQLRGT